MPWVQARRAGRGHKRSQGHDLMGRVSISRMMDKLATMCKMDYSTNWSNSIFSKGWRTGYLKGSNAASHTESSMCTSRLHSKVG